MGTAKKVGESDPGRCEGQLEPKSGDNGFEPHSRSVKGRKSVPA